MPESLFVSCTPGLEGVLTRELHALGLQATQVPGGAEVQGSTGSYEVCNLWLRTATRVLLRVGTLGHPRELPSLELAGVQPKGAPVVFEVSGERPHEWKLAAAKRWKPTSAPEALAVYLRDVNGVCTVSVDTSGTALYQRGARQETGRAPMRETLAAGVLALVGYDGKLPLWDVMCGSGTLVLEASELAQGLAPGRLRTFAFERFPSHDSARWKALPREKPIDAPVRILGSDLNAGALGVARRNARRAQLKQPPTLERLDATQLPAQTGTPGFVVANFPYGKRVGDAREIDSLARKVGASLRKAVPGWRFGFLMNSDVGALGLKLEGQAEVSNGGIRCFVVWGRV